MRLLALLALLVTLTLLALPSARADGLYFTEQLGAARPGGELGHYFDGGLAGHIGLGVHLDGWAVEASVDINDLRGERFLAPAEYQAVAWGVGIRRFLPVTEHLRLYGRAGLQRMELSGDPGAIAAGYAGRALDYGGGVVLSGRVPWLGFLFSPLFFCDCGPKVSAGLWFDVGERVVSLHKARASDLGGYLDTWLLGLSLGGSL